MADERETSAATSTLAPEAPGQAVPTRPDGLTNGASTDGGPAGNGSGPSGGGGGDGESASPQRRRFGIQQIRALVVPAVIVVVLIAALVGVDVYLNNQWYVSTDNAQVVGTPVPEGIVTTAGTVESISVQVGQAVHQGQELATVVLPIVSNSAIVRAPVVARFDGIVIQIPVGVGATVTPGQAIVVVVDPSTVYVNANIDENDVKRIAPGQPVDVTLDALNTTISGTVDSITPASAATFSLLPQDNTTGTFTKVTQLVPVKIDIDTAAQTVPVGTSAEVKIHVAPGH